MSVASKFVLPVEDERIVARDLQIRLKRLGYEVPYVASSKAEAMHLLENNRPDLVLMDITLNGCPDGIGAAQEIRERFDLPVIYLTAHSDTDTLDRAKRTEPSGYVLKPFEDRELMVAIETATHKHGAEKRLRQTERWLAATLCSIGDAVITMDRSLQVTFMNKVAEELTGWTTNEAIGKDLFAVFHLSEERAEATAHDLIRAVLLEGAASALEDPILVAKTGKHISVSDSVAPILDENGENAGVVLVFRDVTEKERAEREIRERGEQQAAANRLAQRALAGLELQTLIDEACAMVARLLNADVCELLEFADNRRQLRARSGGPAFWPIDCFCRGLLERSEPTIAHRSAADDPFLDRHQANSAVAVMVGAPEKPYGILAAYSRAARTFTSNELEFLQAIAYTLRSALDRQAMEKRLRETEQMQSIGVLAGGVAHDFNNLLAVIMGHADEARQQCGTCGPMCAILAASERAADLTRQLLAYSGKGRFVIERISLSDLISESADALRRSVPPRVTLHFDSPRTCRCWRPTRTRFARSW
jgi:PAS domain S-box-containing protein